jgi:hypothetical protein
MSWIAREKQLGVINNPIMNRQPTHDLITKEVVAYIDRVCKQNTNGRFSYSGHMVSPDVYQIMYQEHKVGARLKPLTHLYSIIRISEEHEIVEEPQQTIFIETEMELDNDIRVQDSYGGSKNITGEKQRISQTSLWD